MIQDIIAFLIIAFAFGFLIWNILRFFNLVGKKTANSSNCGGCTSGCEMKGINQSKNKYRRSNASIDSIYNFLNRAIVSAGSVEPKIKLPATRMSTPES